MNDIVSLKAEIRETFGSGPARALRRKGMVPAIIYGARNKPLPIIIEEKEITKHYRRPQYISQVIEFQVADKKYLTLPQAIELNPLTEIVSHADFVFLEDKMQKMQVPIIYLNKENCIGVKRGGYFNIIKRTLNIISSVQKLPRKVEIDTTNLGIGTSIKVKDVPLPEGVRLLDKNDFVIASVIGKRGKNTEIDEEEKEEGTTKTPETK